MSKKDYRYKNMLYDITSMKSRTEYGELRKICKEIYLKTLSDKYEIDTEKERVKNNLDSIKLPYFQMTLSLTVSFISFIVTFCFSYILKESELFLIIVFGIFSIILFIFFSKTTDIFLESKRKVNLYNICICVLDELENEMIISNKINNSDIVEEIKANDIEDNNKINRAKRIKEKLK